MARKTPVIVSKSDVRSTVSSLRLQHLPTASHQGDVAEKLVSDIMGGGEITPLYLLNFLSSISGY